MVKRHHGTLFRLGESVVIVGLSTFLLLHPVSCYYGFKYYDDMTEKIIASKTIDDLKSSVPQDWLDEVRFEKAGKCYTLANSCAVGGNLIAGKLSYWETFLLQVIDEL